MTSRYITLPALALSVLLGGCASSGPNAQRGAAAGGALGAIAGAIIGNNSHGGNGATGALIGAAFGAVAGGAAGSIKDEENAARQHQQYDSSVPYQPPQQHHRTYSSVSTVAHVPQPPSSMPSETIPPAPNSTAIWVPGYWDYNGVSYVWMPGRWEVPPPDKQDFMAGHWEVHDNAYVFVRGHWE